MISVNAVMKHVGLNGEVIKGVSSKSGKEYTAYNITWVNEQGRETQIKQVFLSDLELQMLEILQSQLVTSSKK